MWTLEIECKSAWHEGAAAQNILYTTVYILHGAADEAGASNSGEHLRVSRGG